MLEDDVALPSGCLLEPLLSRENHRFYLVYGVVIMMSFLITPK
jgi:hypothetical protein